MWKSETCQFFCTINSNRCAKIVKHVWIFGVCFLSHVKIEKKTGLTFWIFELHGNNWWLVAFNVCEWKIVSGESTTRWVVYWSKILNIGWTFAFAWYPNQVALHPNHFKFVCNELNSSTDIQMNIYLSRIASSCNRIFQWLRHFLVYCAFLSIMDVWVTSFVEHSWFPIVNLKWNRILVFTVTRNICYVKWENVLTLFNFRKMHGLLSGKPYLLFVFAGEQLFSDSTRKRQYLLVAAGCSKPQLGSMLSSNFGSLYSAFEMCYNWYESNIKCSVCGCMCIYLLKIYRQCHANSAYYPDGSLCTRPMCCPSSLLVASVGNQVLGLCR